MKKSKLVSLIIVCLLVLCIAAYAQVGGKPKEVKIPTINLSPSNLGNSTLYNSWPLVLSVSIWIDEADIPKTDTAPVPISIKMKGKAWQDALVVEIKLKSGAVIKSPLNLIADEKPIQNLTMDGSIEVYWILSPEDTKLIPEGDYRIKVTIDPKLLDEDISKKVSFESDDYYLRVSKEPSTLTDELKTEKDFMMAQYYFIKGDKKEASNIIEALLAKDPECIGAYQIKASLLSLDGKNAEAISELDKAWGIYDKKYPDACPPISLLTLRDKIMDKIELKTIPKED